MTTKIFLICPECGLRFEKAHHRQEFCTPAHSKTYSNRQLAEGQRTNALVKAWRLGRNTSDPALKAAAKRAFIQLCREADALIQADTAAGRMSALKVYARRDAAGLLDFQGPVNSRA